MSDGVSPMEDGGKQRTVVYCHNCSKNFVAELDFDLEGNHVAECAHCGHQHYRTIKAGKITESRWGSSNGCDSNSCIPATTWKLTVIKKECSTVSDFIRERWLNRSDYDGR